MQSEIRVLTLRFTIFVVVSMSLPAMLPAQLTCPCEEDHPLGSCLITNLNAPGDYPGQSPGSAAVVVRETDVDVVENWLFVVDLFNGFTYRYDARQLDAAPTALISPRGSATTTGIAYDPTSDRLYWAIDDRIIVTEVPVASAEEFTDVTTVVGGETVPLEIPVDLEGLAEGALGDPDLAGRLGGITYHVGRNTIWGVDIVNDLYFEMGLDGRLVPNDQGAPNHFVNPRKHPLGGGAYGNSLTFVNTAEGEFLDLPVGSAVDQRPTQVIRVHAPTDSQQSGVEFGQDTGISYPIFPTLVIEPVGGPSFPTGIAFWRDSCAGGQHSEFLLIDLPEGETDAILEVSADPPVATNVAEFHAEPSDGASVQLTWRGTGGYTDLTIFRRKLTDDAAEDVEVFSFSSAGGAEDPEGHLDTTLGIDADGTYEYRVEASASGSRASDVFSVVTVGRGSPVAVGLFTGGEDNDSRNPPTPFAVTHSTDTVYVVDFNTGVAQLFGVGDLQPVSNVRGPFAAEGETTGIAFNEQDGMLYWAGRLQDDSQFIQKTDLTGNNPGPRLPIQFPTSFVRSPHFGDMSYDAVRDQFWITDLRNNVLFAVAPDGSFQAGSVIENPVPDGVLSGGVEVADADAQGVVLDIPTGPEGGMVDRLLRNRYDLGDVGSPTLEVRLELARVMGSALVGGVDWLDDRNVEIVVGTDTRRVYGLSLQPVQVSGTPFQRGDINNDGQTNISDPSFLLSWLFKGGTPPTCENSADTDDDGAVNISDALALFNYLFRGDVPPAPPSDACGFDVTDSPLGCDSSFCSAP